jgi:hypothetical protein
MLSSIDYTFYCAISFPVHCFVVRILCGKSVHAVLAVRYYYPKKLIQEN